MLVSKQFTGAVRMEISKEIFLRKMLTIFKVLLWIVILLIIYSVFIYLAQVMRVYAFDAVCSPNNRHLPDSLLYNVDWCEEWWWHPYRAFTHVITATVASLGVIWLGNVLLAKDWSKHFYAGFWVHLFVLVHILEICSPVPFGDFYSHSCLFNFPSTTKDLCELQLGKLGDVRFYYPITFWLTYSYAHLSSINFFKHSRKR